MRDFTDSEKHIIRELVTQVQVSEGLLHVGLLVRKLLIESDEALSLLMKPSEDAAYILLHQKADEAAQDELTARVRDTVYEVVTIYNLLEELESKGQIRLFGKPIEDPKGLGDLFPNDESAEDFQEFQDQFDDPDLAKRTFFDQFADTVAIPQPLANFVFGSIGKFIFVSESLRRLVDRDFKTPEEIRHEEEIDLLEKRLKNEKYYSKRNLYGTWAIAIISFVAWLTTLTTLVFFLMQRSHLHFGAETKTRVFRGPRCPTTQRGTPVLY